jgi:DNA mismatch repair protein MutS
LECVCDIERIVGRLAVGRASPRDMSALGKCLVSLPKLLEQLNQLTHATEVAPELVSLGAFCAQQAKYLTEAIAPEPAPHLREGGVIADRFDAELDRLRDIGTNSQQWLARYQGQLATESGISSLRIGFNKVFGYYIEVTDSHREKVPLPGLGSRRSRTPSGTSLMN